MLRRQNETDNWGWGLKLNWHDRKVMTGHPHEVRDTRPSLQKVTTKITHMIQIISTDVRYIVDLSNFWRTRMHSSRMRTGRTLTVFRKFETPPPKKLKRSPRKIGDPPPQKFGGPPPENLEEPPWKFGGPPWDQIPPRDQTPPLWTEWQTGVKILPWPKLRFGR